MIKLPKIFGIIFTNWIFDKLKRFVGLSQIMKLNLGRRQQSFKFLLRDINYKIYLARFMDFKLDNVIQVLFCTDNQRRAEAQRFVDQIPINNFDQGIQAFLITMNHENTQVATMAALLLKKKYLEPKQMSEKLSINRLEYIIKSVQGCMTSDKPVLFLKRCCDIMVKVYNQANQQKQLITLIHAMATSDAHNMKMALYYMIEIICECSFDDKLLMQHAAALEVIFQKGLMDENNQIKVAAFKTLTIFLSSIDDEKMVKKFEAVLQVLISKAIQLIKFDQESGVTALESMNQLIEAHPKFIRPIVPQLLSIYTEIMETSALLTNLRTTAMFGVLMICINHPAIVRKNDYFKTNMVPAYMKMLSQINGISMEQWSQQLNDEVMSKNDISLSTEEHLGQILPELKNKFMLPLFIPYIQQYLASSQIEHQHAGLVAMAILTEDCHESFKSNLKNIIELIIPMMKTNNPRIMHDILMALGYMSQEFSPELQQNYGNIMLEFMIACLQYPALKVQFKAVQCLQNFEKGLMDHREVKVMEQYLPQIMQEIARIFEYSFMKMNYILLEDVLETITNIAEMNPFQNYYKVFMPGMKKILTMIGSENQQQIMVKAKTVQTIGYLLASVKTHPELFESDCQEIMQSMMKMSSSMDFDDPMQKAIFVVYENVATSLKENFAMYAQHIYPLVLQSANRKIEFTVIQENEVSKAEDLKKKKHNYAAYKLDLKIDGVKSLVLNTDHLAQKIEATNLMVQMAEDMGKGFAPFIEQTIPTIKQLISYKHNKQIRSNMIETITHMIADCSTNEQKAFVVNQTFECVCSELATTIKQKDAISMAAIIEAMSVMMPYMTQQMAARVPNMMIAALSLVKSQSAEIEKQYCDRDMDEALQEEMGEQVQEVQESLEYIEKIIKMGQGIPAFENLRTMFPSDYQFE